MYGFQHLPSQQQQRFWVYNGSNRPTNGFQPWIKPPGISFVHIICIGAGAGGSSAFPYSASSGARGGSGGGAGSMNSVFLPAYLVPDTLYINVGIGGAGGAASNVAGTANVAQAGTSTYVGFYPAQSAAVSFCMANPGGAGSLPVGSAGAIGGNGGATATSTFFPISQVGLRNYIGGQAGGTGGQTGAANNITATYRITGGGGGSGNSVGGVVGSGAIINMAGEYALQAISPSPAGQNGAKIQDLIKFLSAGGTGASSSTTISGSDGGWGGFGSGGGGGSVGPGLGGAGGNGGDGFVIITCG